jgi:hypothetical protein
MSVLDGLDLEDHLQACDLGRDPRLGRRTTGERILEE